MRPEEIISQLEDAAHSPDLISQWYILTEKWNSQKAGMETVEPILRFMENNPSLDYGMPGPLVHFVERFFKSGYEQRLVDSIQRKPTFHTVWMLNRLINGTKEPPLKRYYIEILSEAKTSPFADERTIESVNEFLGKRK